MKKIIILRLLAGVLIAFSFISVVYAQDTFSDYNRPHFGLEAGLNASWFGSRVYPFDKNSPAYANSPYDGDFTAFSIGVHAGLTVDKRISPSVSLAAELLFNGRGSDNMIKNNNVVLLDTAGNQTDAYDNYNYVLYYMELPLMLQFDMNSNDSHVSSRFYIGLAPGILMIHQTNYQYYSTDPNTGDVGTNVENKQLNNVRGFNLSPIIGLWFSEKNTSSPVKLFGDIRLEYTALTVFNKPAMEEENLQTRMTTLSFGFGIRF